MLYVKCVSNERVLVIIFIIIIKENNLNAFPVFPEESEPS